MPKGDTKRQGLEDLIGVDQLTPSFRRMFEWKIIVFLRPDPYLLVSNWASSMPATVGLQL
jgi:hypothetical protein